ncbi:MAG TPA: glycosyltransferase family 9 protein [Candidatus Omnitrophica bacterium]|nr:glycosyltransferase family 9 protein [Candidatus Omnitrophota bacterium]
MKILFITLSNIGDCILTLPVLDALIDKYPDAALDVLSGPRVKEIFINNSFIKKSIVYNKQSSLREKLGLVLQLYKEGYDLIIDLKHTMLPFLLRARLGTRLFNPPKNILHARKRNFARLKNDLGLDAKFTEKHFFNKSKTALDDFGKYVVVAAGARGILKRWNKEEFAKLSKWIIDDYGLNIVLVGDNDDKVITDSIASAIGKGVFNLAGKTDLAGLSDIIRGSSLIISCDSASLHLASYLNRPIIAVFTATDPKKYGPWSDENIVVCADIDCAPCEKAECERGSFECINSITADAVYRIVKKILK